MKTYRFGGGVALALAVLLAAWQPAAGQKKYPTMGTVERHDPRFDKLIPLKGAVLDRIRQAVDIVSKKASPEETQAYRQLFVTIAERAANASKEGGFLGFGGERVSANEKAFLEEVRQAAGAA